MNKHLTYSLAAVFLVLLTVFMACKQGNNQSAKRASSGATLELLIVTENKDHWEGTLGDTIRNYFGADQLTLPQPEPLFTLANLEASTFGKMFQPHHNILILSVDNTFEKPLIETRQDLWAAPQRVIKVTAPTYESLIASVDSNKAAFRRVFLETEYERTDKNHKTLLENKAIQPLVERFKLYMNIPVGYDLAKETSNFVWIRKETMKDSQGIFVYLESYTDTSQFTNDSIILRRNYYTMTYVPGSRDGSFMTTSMAHVTPVFKRINLNGKFAVETRGIWETVGDFMGGPFVSYTMADEKHNRLVTVEGYVYAPNAPKSLLLHQVDAICRTVAFAD